MLLATMGVRYPKALTDEMITRTAHRWQLDSGGVFIMDTAFTQLLNPDATEGHPLTKALFQPAQLRVYGTNDTLIAILANCHPGGFPNLKWERSLWHEGFPPKRSIRIDSAVTFTTDARYLRPINGAALAARNPDRPAVLFIWTRFMGRQTKRLLKYTMRMRATWPQADWYFANMDALFVEAEY